MSKFIAISLPALWITYCIFLDHEYAWVLRSLIGTHIGYACAYVWSYNNAWKELVNYLLVDREK